MQRCFVSQINSYAHIRSSTFSSIYISDNTFSGKCATRTRNTCRSARMIPWIKPQLCAPYAWYVRLAPPRVLVANAVREQRSRLRKYGARLPACTTDNGIAGMHVSLEKLQTPFPRDTHNAASHSITGKIPRSFYPRKHQKERSDRTNPVRSTWTFYVAFPLPPPPPPRPVPPLLAEI